MCVYIYIKNSSSDSSADDDLLPLAYFSGQKKNAKTKVDSPVRASRKSGGTVATVGIRVNIFCKKKK